MKTSFHLLAGLLVFAALLFTSCEKEELAAPGAAETATTATTSVTPASLSERTGSSSCYMLGLPISFTLEDGSTVTATDYDELDAIFSTQGDLVVDVVYPVTLVDFESGVTVTAQNEAEFVSYLEQCELLSGGVDTTFMDTSFVNTVDTSWHPCDSIDVVFGGILCYEFVFPVSLVLEDGTSVVANDEAELAAFYATSSNWPVDFVYPVNLVSVEDGTAVSANDADELSVLFQSCFVGGPIVGGPGGFDFDDQDLSNDAIISLVAASLTALNADACYAFTYPVTVTDRDDVAITVADDSGWEQVLTTAGIGVQFQYPVQVTDRTTGAVSDVANDDDATALSSACFN